MTHGPTATETRQRAAQAALDALGGAMAENERMSVQCPRSHHVAVVYDTVAGPVVLTHPGPHAHGSKDFVDTGHHATRPANRVDLLTVGRGVGDEVPAWCDCGPIELSRAALLARLRAGDRTMRIG
jgi:hypothetical protein